MRERLQGFGQDLTTRGLATTTRFDIDDGALIAMVRNSDGAVASIDVVGTDGVFILGLGDGHRRYAIRHETAEKWATIQDFMECVELFMAGEYDEQSTATERTIRLGVMRQRVIVTRIGSFERLRRGKSGKSCPA